MPALNKFDNTTCVVSSNISYEEGGCAKQSLFELTSAGFEVEYAYYLTQIVCSSCKAVMSIYADVETNVEPQPLLHTHHVFIILENAS